MHWLVANDCPGSSLLGSVGIDATQLGRCTWLFGRLTAHNLTFNELIERTSKSDGSFHQRMRHLDGAGMTKELTMRIPGFSVAVAALLVATACDAEPSQRWDGEAVGVAAAVPQVGSNAILERLIDLELVGGNLAYFEAISGPPKTIEDIYRTYRPGDCYVTVEADGQTITSIGYAVSAECNPAGFGMRFYGHTLEDARVELGGGQYGTSCLDMCGNALDPTYGVFVPGYRTNGYRNFNIDGQPTEPEQYERIYVWRSGLIAKYGDGGTAEARGYRCNSTDAASNREALKDIPVTYVRVFRSAETNSC